MTKSLFQKTLSLGTLVLVGCALALPASAKDIAKNPCATKPANPCAQPVKKMAKGKAKGKHKPANPCAAKPANPCSMKK